MGLIWMSAPLGDKMKGYNMIHKFRAWDKKNKLMWDVTEIRWRTNSQRREIFYIRGTCDYRGQKEVNLGCHADHADINDIILMQFIEYKDKNKIRLCHDDIIKCPVSNKSEDYLQLEAGKNDYVIRVISIPEVYQEGLPDDCEKIGNIHENPELIKE